MSRKTHEKVYSNHISNIYLTFSARATVHVHFCISEFVNIFLSDAKDSVCGKCCTQNYSSNNNCCKDIKVVKKAPDTHGGKLDRDCAHIFQVVRSFLSSFSAG